MALFTVSLIMSKRLVVLVTGGRGQLGQALCAEAVDFSEISLITTDFTEVDICDPASLFSAITRYKPQVIINCAAYTAVDKAEVEIEHAFRLNAAAVAHLADMAKQHNIVLLQLSTDYVFSGQNCLPYTVHDKPNPLSVYGASKFAGEQALLKSGAAGAVIRSSWLYSEYASNFVKTMLKLAETRDNVQVVVDQVGSPTYARDLACALLNMARSYSSMMFKPAQVWHFSNTGVASWYDVAKSIFELKGIICQVEPIPSTAFPSAAKRPAYSVLATDKFATNFAYSIPYWRASLALCLKRLSSLSK